MASIPRSKINWLRVESGIRKRTNSDGVTVYEVRVRRKGRPERTFTCPTLREARKFRDQAQAPCLGRKTQSGQPWAA